MFYSFSSRGWFTSGSSIALPGPNLSAMDSGSGDKDRSSADKWGLFAPRSLQKSDSGKAALSHKRRRCGGHFTMCAVSCLLILQSFALWLPSAGSFATQVYRGAQKPSPMELIHIQATQMAKDPATFKPSKMDISVIEGKKTATADPQSQTLGLECSYIHWLLEPCLFQGLWIEHVLCLAPFYLDSDVGKVLFCTSKKSFKLRLELDNNWFLKNILQSLSLCGRSHLFCFSVD